MAATRHLRAKWCDGRERPTGYMGKRPLYVGIDPGADGFIVTSDGRRLVSAWEIPYVDKRPDLHELRRMFRALARRGVAMAAIEHQQVFGRMAGAAHSFSSGFSYAALQASLVWAEIPFEVVKPTTWKQALGINKVAPKLPKIPPKPSKGDTVGLRVWRQKKKRVEAQRNSLSAKARKDRKTFSIRKAQELDPRADFRKSELAKVPHDGKAEGFLLAIYAFRISGG